MSRRYFFKAFRLIFPGHSQLQEKSLNYSIHFSICEKVREWTGKLKTFKMDSEAILGPKWTPRGVLESGEHVESDFDWLRSRQLGSARSSQTWPLNLSAISGYFFTLFVSSVLRISSAIQLWPLRTDWLQFMHWIRKFNCQCLSYAPGCLDPI